MYRMRKIIIRLFLCLLFMITATGVSAQVTVNANNITIGQTIHLIEQNGKYNFFYTNDLPGLDKLVSITATNQDIKTVLKKLFNDTKISYKIRDNNQIVLTVVGKGDTGSTLSVNEPTKITGVVKDQTTGETLIGVSVTVLGTKTGVITDQNGNFSIVIPNASSVLSFSYIGYINEKLNPKESNLEILLSQETKDLDEVVVTALGIVKKEKSLTYSTQSVKGDELTRAKDLNMINSLAGKTAGVQILKSSSGLGGSVKVNIRGNRSASGSNQPLYVIDGIPVSNNNSETSVTTLGGTNDGANHDSGDGISNLNPDDVESMTILKGPAAAALYGAQAANGVVIITTKKGQAGHTAIMFSTSNIFENVTLLPKLQSQYGNGISSWDTTPSSIGHNVSDFFQTGFTTINAVTLSSGNDRLQNYFSYANSSANGVIEGNKLMKHNFNFRESAQLFNNKFTIDANVNLLNQKIDNATTPGGLYMNPLVGLYTFPRGADFSTYQTNFEKYDPVRKIYTQNWYDLNNDKNQNPYWLLNRTGNENIRNRAIANVTLKWKFNDHLNIQARGNGDVISDNFNQHYNAGTNTNIAGTNGRYVAYTGSEMNTYADVLLGYNNKMNDFALTFNVGSSISHNEVKSTRLDSHPSSVGLFFVNQFSVANMDLNNGYIEEVNSTRENQSVFASAQLGYKNWLFVDASARNDWSSTLAFTNSMKKGYFYPSVGFSGIISDAVKLPEVLNFLKIRATVSQVGNSLPMYVSNSLDKIGAGGKLIPNTITVAPGTSLQPEKTNSYEAGLEAKFFESRISLDVTPYLTNTYNQLFTLPAPSGSGYSFYYINAGNIQNSGAEVILGFVPVNNEDFKWSSHINYAFNRNKVIALSDSLKFFPLGLLGTDSYQMRLVKDGSFGDIYGRAFDRDNSGKIIFDSKGMPTINPDFQKIGNSAAKFNLGFDNMFTYKNWSLYFLIDCRVGGNVLSITEAENDINGVSQTTANARKNGYVMLEGTKVTDVQGFYTLIGGRAGVSEYYMYDATNVRLREVSLCYSLPKTILGKSFVKGVDLSVIGKNLFFFYNKAPYDPDSQMSVGNNLQGVDVFGMPSTRSLGINVKVNF